MTTLSRQGAVLLIVLGITVLGGCGGSSESAPSKSAFIKHADAICERTDEEQTKGLEEAAKKGSIEKMSSAEQLDLAVELGLPPIQKEGEEIGDLTPPSGDESKVEAYVDAIEEGTKKAEANPSLLTSGAGPFEKADKLGKSYGFEDCAESS